jgi:hypothetical protein
MTNKKRDAAIARYRRAADLDSERFADLCHALGLDRRRDLRFADLSDISFAGADLDGVDLTGARLRRCSFKGARIKGCIFDQAEVGQIGSGEPTTDLKEAEDYAAFAAGYRASPTAPKDLSHLPAGTLYFVAPDDIRMKREVSRRVRLVPQVGPGHSVAAVKAIPDGLKIASGSNDNTVKLWSVRTGRLLQNLDGHTGWVNALSISPNGRSITSGSADKSVRLWDAETGQLICAMEGHFNSVSSVALAPDSQTVAATTAPLIYGVPRMGGCSVPFSGIVT